MSGRRFYERMIHQAAKLKGIDPLILRARMKKKLIERKVIKQSTKELSENELKKIAWMIHDNIYFSH